MMAKEYIESEALIDEVESTQWYHISHQKNLVQGAACEADALYKATDIYSVIKSAPTADVVEVRHGNWLTKEYQYGEDGVSDEWIEKTAEQGDYAYCSLCLKEALLNGCEDWVLSDYCPHCGAKMDGKDG